LVDPEGCGINSVISGMVFEGQDVAPDVQEEMDSFEGESLKDFLVAYIQAAQELAIGLRTDDELSVVVTFKNIDGKLRSLVRLDASESVRIHLIAIDDLGSNVAS